MKNKNSAVKIWARLTSAIVFGTIIFIFLYVFLKGIGAISLDFLTQKPKGAVLGTEGGIFPAIVGSLLFTLVAVLISSILGIATAIYHIFYCKNKCVSFLISIVMQCMSGVPSIVLGLFGYSLFVLRFGLGKCILAGGLTQAIMILPFLEVRAEKSLREADKSYINASYSLGATRSYTLRKIVIPQQLPSLVSDVVLAALYAVGAAAPLIFTGAVILSSVPTSLMKPSMALPYHLYMLLTQGTSSQNAYGTAFVLMALVLISNILATSFVWRKNKQWTK